MYPCIATALQLLPNVHSAAKEKVTFFLKPIYLYMCLIYIDLQSESIYINKGNTSNFQEGRLRKHVSPREIPQITVERDIKQRYHRGG